jgi:hypothetical protein
MDNLAGKFEEISLLRKEPQMESPEQENQAEPSKSLEELRKENIERLTLEARRFIDGKRDAYGERKALGQLNAAGTEINQEDLRDPISENENETENQERKGFIGRLKEKLALRNLERQGFEDSKRTLEFLSYLENNFDLRNSESYSKYLRRYVIRRLKKDGHRIIGKEEDAKGDGKIIFEENLSGKENLELWKKMLENSPNDPLGVIRALGAGEDKPPLFFIKSKNFELLLNDPDILKKIDIIKKIGINIPPWQLHTLRECCEAINVTSLNPELVREIGDLVASSELATSSYELGSLVKIFSDERKRKLINAAMSVGGKISELGYSWYSINLNLHNLLESGIESEVSKAEGLGINIPDVIKAGIRELSNSGTEQADVENIVPDIGEDKLIEFVRDMAALSYNGSIPLSQLNLVEVFYEIPNFWASFEAYRQLGIIKEEEGGGFDIIKIAEAMPRQMREYVRDKKIFDAHGYTPPTDPILDLFDKAKLDFVKQIAKSHSFSLDGNKLNFLLKICEGNKKPFLLSEEGKSLMQYLEKLGINLNTIYVKSEYNDSMRQIIMEPGFLKTLQDFSKYFDCDTRSENDRKNGLFDNQADIENLLFLLNRDDDLQQWSLYALAHFCPQGNNLSLDKANLLFSLNSSTDKLSPNCIPAFERNFNFYFDANFFKFLELNPEMQEELYTLSEDGLLDKKDRPEFYYSNLSTILSIPREKRKDYLEFLDILKEMILPHGMAELIFSKVAEKKDDTAHGEYLGKVKADLKLIREIAHVSDMGGVERVIIEKYFESGSDKTGAEFFENIRNSMEVNRKMMTISWAFSNFFPEDLPIINDINEQLKNGDIQEIAEIPQEFLGRLREFSEKYKIGDKGETIVNLLAAREGKKILDSGENFSWQILFQNMNTEFSRFQRIIDMHGYENIPQGIRASIGMEYEITAGGAIQSGFEKKNFMSFKRSISRISEHAKIGRGTDPLHEIATQPTDNPYLMLLEMKLLQDLEFIDFNFRPAESGGYYGAATGFHLSLGGEQGISRGINASFLSNIISMSNWAGVNLERDVSSVGEIRNRGADSRNIFLLENISPSVELRNFSIDRWEPFEKTISACHYAAIAIQAVERFTKIADTSVVMQLKQDFPESADELIGRLDLMGQMENISTDPIVNEAIFLWLKLQADVFKAVEDHNENFLTNETMGYLDEETKEWVGAGDNSGRNNQRYFEEGLRNFNSSNSQGKRYETLKEFFKSEFVIDPVSVFSQPSVKNANSITHIGNLFLTKFSDLYGGVGNEKKKKADPNVFSFLANTRQNGVKIESRKQNDVEKTIFDRKGEPSEGYYYMQGASEKMIIHQAQKLLLKFNQDVANLLKTRSPKEQIGSDDLALAA